MGDKMEDIIKKIKQVKDSDEEIKIIIENMILFWEKNLDVLGRDIGGYQLVELEIDTNNFQNYIFNQEDEENAEIFGHGYDTAIELGRYTCHMEFKRASRYYHQMLISTFLVDVNRKLDSILISNKSSKIIELKEKIKCLLR
jgi:hypothetical protein